MSIIGLRGKPVRGEREQLGGQAAQNERADIMTVLPGKFIKWTDKDKQEAEIEVLHIPMMAGKELKIPNLKSIPVKFSRGGCGGKGDGGSVMTYPMKEGDPVEINFNGRDTEKWYKEGGAQKAHTNRMHNLSDAYVVPGGMRDEKQAVKKYSEKTAQWRSTAEDGYPKIDQDVEKKTWTVNADAETSITMKPGEITVKAKKIVLESTDGSKITIENNITIKPAGQLLEG